MKKYWGVEYSSTYSWLRNKMELSGRLHVVRVLPPPRVRVPDIPWIGGWVGPRVSLDMVVKRKYSIIAPAGNWTPVVQSAV